jgi:polysaccharide biosynthesis/export protein
VAEPTPGNKYRKFCVMHISHPQGKIIRPFLGLLAVVLMLSGCLSQATNSELAGAPKGVTPALIQPASPQPYRLQIGDVMDVKVMLAPEFNDQVIVRPDGLISTTIARDIPAFGYTPAQLQQELEAVYRTQLRDPKVSVIIRSFAPTRVYVTGEVNAPGEFITVGPNFTLLQAIARAGGVKNSAGTKEVIILRRGAGDKPVAYKANYLAAATGNDPSSDVRLAPYDVVYVPRSDVGDAYLYFQQYVQQFVPASFGMNYQLNNVGVVNR